RPAEAASDYYSECNDLGDTASFNNSFVDFTFDTWLEYGKRKTSASRYSTCGTGATLDPNGEVWFYAGAYSAAKFTMKFPVEGRLSKTFTPVDIFWLGQAGTTGGSVAYQLQLFGYDLMDPKSVSLYLGQPITFASLGMEAPSASWGSKIYNVEIGFPIYATAKVEAGLTIGLDEEETSITISQLNARVDPCDGKTTHDGLCFGEVGDGTSKTSDEYDALCQASGGFLAPVRDETDLLLITEAKTSGDKSLVGIRGTGFRVTQSFPGLGTIQQQDSEKYQNIYTTELGISQLKSYTNWRSGFPKRLDDYSSDECETATYSGMTFKTCSDTSLVKVAPNGEMGDVNDPAAGTSAICAYRAISGATKGGWGVDVKITPYINTDIKSDLDISVVGARGGINVMDVSAPIELGVKFEELQSSDVLVTLSARLSVIVEILSGRAKWWYDIGIYDDSGNLLKFDTVWQDTWKIINARTSFTF
ncbi:MAG: hypothetical protein KC492_27955, partial [Myxococcales bacterium]|nr:hypothetical protein [Myxococcales bacterium]